MIIERLHSIRIVMAVSQTEPGGLHAPFRRETLTYGGPHREVSCNSRRIVAAQVCLVPNAPYLYQGYHGGSVHAEYSVC